MCADETLTEGDRCRRWCSSLYKFLGVSRSGCAQCVGTKHSRREAVGVVGTVRHCDQAMYMEACSFQPSSLSLRSSLAVSLALAARRCSWECASKRDHRIEHSMTHKRWGHVSYPACQPVLACLLSPVSISQKCIIQKRNIKCFHKREYFTTEMYFIKREMYSLREKCIHKREHL